MVPCSGCEACKRERCRFTKPLTGDIVKCDDCEKSYKYFIWAMGSDRYLCRGCVRKRPSAYLDNIDAIDIDKEQDIIYDEIDKEERMNSREKKAHPPRRVKRESLDYDKVWQKMKKKTITEHKAMEKKREIQKGI